MFNNLFVMRLPPGAGHALVDPVANERLGDHRIRPCGPNEIASLGFSAPRGEEAPDELAVVINQRALVQVSKIERVIPPQVIERAVNERIATQTAKGAQRVGAADRRRIREEVIAELLPRAFQKETTIQAFIDPNAGWCVVNTASKGAAEDVASVLRLALGSFPATHLSPECPPSGVMTAWLRDKQLPEGLDFGTECELHYVTDKKSVWRGRNIEIDSGEVDEHIAAGMQVAQIALVLNERVSFVLDTDLCLRKWRLTDVALEEADKGEGRSTLDTAFALLAAEAERALLQIEKWFRISRPAARKAA